METILRIEELPSFKRTAEDWQTFEGYEIITDEQSVKIGVSSGQSCCESFGYLTTNDDLKDFIGADLTGISIVDTALNNKKIEELEYLDQGGAMFVNIETSNGVLQIVVYNAHNGYYGHDGILISKQLNKEVSL